MTRKRSRKKMIEFAKPGPDDEDDVDQEPVEVSKEFADFAHDILEEQAKVEAAAKEEDAPVLMAMAGPFTVRLNDVVDYEGRSVARCGYLHNTRVSGPPMAEVVCAALNRGYRKV